MSAQPQLEIFPFDEFEQLREAREIIRQESLALQDIARQLDQGFTTAVRRIVDCPGTVVVTGMGKAGLIGRKLVATFSSTGTRAMFLHPAEAVHGDLGGVRAGDLVLALSNSGETEELCRLLPILTKMEIPVIAITARETSTLGVASELVLRLGRLPEAGQLGLAPTTSTTAMLALGDALALVVSRAKGFTPQQFAMFHPAGSLGKKLQTIPDVMRQGDQLRVAPETATVREVFVGHSITGRRTGAVMLVDDQGCLSGLFTDSDLVRLLESRREEQLDRPISEVMTAAPKCVSCESPLQDAIALLSEYRISELPVTDASCRPVGLIDITDVLSLLPEGRME
ncbi:MAG: KpsF/GutQ family sugar-phosphate isomerase [Planctomycetes bacterium]|nr:KpsF/GutQ family sugar-phosphate isomerase [Planctomycetota bacterium]